MRKREKNILIALLLFGMGIFLKNYNQYFEILLLVAAYIIVGRGVLLKAFKNIKRREVFDENFLMTIATLGAVAIGEYPEAVAVMLFYEIGELFQSYAVSKSRKSIAELMDIKPKYANVIRENKVEVVEPDEVKIGEIIEIRTGERVPLDSIIIEGFATLDTSSLTGESLPLEVKKGMDILSGCVNTNGLIQAKVTKKYFDSTVSKILDLVENAAGRKSKSERLITKFSKIYTPIVVFLAILLAIIPPLTFSYGDWKEWIFRALAFLVVSCPCAFVISVPMSFFGGIGAASTAGILVKGGNYLEALADIDTVIFDKTGTLTRGIFKVQKIEVLDKKYSEEEILDLVVLAESSSNHPISKSILKYHPKEIVKNDIQEIKEISGKGIKAKVKNINISIGNEKLVTLPEDFILDEIGTILYIAIEGKFVAYFVIADEIKKTAKEDIENLKKIGINKTIMLTGDSEKIGRNVAENLGLDEFYTNLLPADKVEKFEEILSKRKNSKKKIAFIGDGINDAPVLARADVGIAMGAIGSDSAIEAADIVIMTDELKKIVSAVKISRKTIKIAVQNMLIAFIIKVIALILSALGMATMWEAVFADVGVTILAVLNSLRALKVEK
ncbi:MAG: cadmium-translocating P-type ATPase [Fusobacterium sp.]|nr:cadmium-translocating P-type ATPase [Fusobacterium sp.]